MLQVENKPKVKKVQWSSSNKKVAVVSNKGKVTAQKAGATKITAKIGNKKYTCKITVKKDDHSKADTKSVLSEEVLNQSEVAALKKLIEEQKELGNIMSADITDTKCYIWNNDGSLESISAMLAGTVSLQDFPALVTLDTGVYIDDEYKESYDKGKLTALDVTKNPLLSYLNCGDNQLTELDVTKNLALEDFFCSGNKLKVLNVTKNSVLVMFYCGDNMLTTLNIKKNQNLDTLHCEGNKIKTLDLTKNQLLEEFKCDDTVKVVR